LLRAIELDPKYGSPYNNIGNYFIRSGRPKEAIEWLEKGKLADPARSDLYWNAGIAYRDSGNFEEAVRNWKKCIELDPRTEPQLQLEIYNAVRKIYQNSKPVNPEK
jgi:tetratricopeptide (TPR) repeat protein